MNPVKAIARALDAGWFSRLLVVAQFAFAWRILDWSMAQGSTALAAALVRESWAEVAMVIASVGGLIGAVALAPHALLLAATKLYMDARATQPRVIVPGDASDRRGA